ncbi:type II toxin-antitoxin system RelE/ParE family toxin [Paraglaciecola aquimarina]|uniref:Type II toxin-antitoxin system RelE/ParE family toxin n=1 Tax=Paraglaciecola algarum TaxID=3050085 RepID=A0ABS9D387_9ALTE|nr:type II toxin-antitoxin system RelE/ParE family toxin [Paraglaciecola sp. G1-23]MCF2946508.1 type II toxin-antitoxin system RelE/ParE family toxin [Paraglaciecola sp. G1-23]
MEKYKITFKKSVTKDFKTLPKADIKKILTKIDSLAENPRREGAIKLSGHDLYRIRQGLYRIIYQIRDNELVVQVIKLGHRSDVYKRT